MIAIICNNPGRGKTYNYLRNCLSLSACLRLSAFFLAAAFCFAGSQAVAADNYFTHGGNANVTTKGNWTNQTDGKYPSATTTDFHNYIFHPSRLKKTDWSGKQIVVTTPLSCPAKLSFWGASYPEPWILRSDNKDYGWDVGAGGSLSVGSESGTKDPDNAPPKVTELWICGGGKWAAKNIWVGGYSSIDYSGHLVITNGIFSNGISKGSDMRCPVSILAYNVVNLYNGSLLVAGGGSDAVALNVSNQFNVAHMEGGNFSAVFDGNASLTMLNNAVNNNGYIRVGVGANSTGTLELRNGASASTSNKGYISIGVGANSTGTLELSNGASASSKGNFIVCAGDESTGTFKMSGGTLTVGKAVFLGGAGSEGSGRKDTKAKFIMTGGTATSASNTEIGNFTGSATGGYALLSLSGGASYTAKNNLQMGAANGNLADQTWLAVTNGTMSVSQAVYINGGNGGIALGDGAFLTVSGDNGVCTADGGRGYAQVVGGNFAITLGTGSVLQTKKFQYNRQSRGNNQNVAIAFEGGTLKAAADNSPFIPENDRLTVTVNSNGGIIDTNGKSVTIPANITAAGGAASGDLKVTGSGTVTFTGSLAFGGAIDKSPETSLTLSVNSAASLFGSNGGGLKARLASDAAAGTVLFTYSEAPESVPDAAMLLAIKNGLSYADAAKEAATPAKRAFRAVYDATAMQVKLGAPLGVILLAR